MVDRAPAGMGCKAKRMELASRAVRSFGVGPIGRYRDCGGFPAGWPTSRRKLGGPVMGRGHSHSDPQSVQPKVCSLREKHDRRRGEPETRQMIDR